MSVHFRGFEHLLPKGLAWRLQPVGKALRKLFEGLAPAFQYAREFADEVLLDLFPDTTRDLEEWERQFGLEPSPGRSTEELRQAALAAEWAATGGQSPAYIESVLQTAGFDVWVHEWWESGPPYVARDPRDYTEQPLIGSVQCIEDDDPDQVQCVADNEPDQGQCDAFLQNDPHYFVNLDLTPRAPPPIPASSDFWPFFLYLGGETFPDIAVVSADRKAEFERLIQRIKPSQQWIVTLVTYDGVFSDEFSDEFA